MTLSKVLILHEPTLRNTIFKSFVCKLESCLKIGLTLYEPPPNKILIFDNDTHFKNRKQTALSGGFTLWLDPHCGSDDSPNPPPGASLTMQAFLKIVCKLSVCNLKCVF